MRRRGKKKEVNTIIENQTTMRKTHTIKANNMKRWNEECKEFIHDDCEINVIAEHTISGGDDDDI